MSVYIYTLVIYIYLKYRVLSVREVKQRNIVVIHEWTEVPGIIVSTQSLFPTCCVVQETEVADNVLSLYMVFYFFWAWALEYLEDKNLERLKLVVSLCRDLTALLCISWSFLHVEELYLWTAPCYTAERKNVALVVGVVWNSKDDIYLLDLCSWMWLRLWVKPGELGRHLTGWQDLRT